jgi:hypothetical protein
MPEPTGLNPIISGTSQAERKDILMQVVDSGVSIDPDDLMLKIPGLANHFRAIAEAQAQATKSLPIVVHQQVGERLDKHEATLDERLDRHEAILFQTLEKVVAAKPKAVAISPSRLLKGFSPMSGLLGAIATLLVGIPLVWYILIPQEVARQRGGDWAILTYLKTSQGVGFRQFYLNKCHNKPNCK